MQAFIDFLIQPYLESSWFLIILELIAVVFGIASVLFARKENILVFPTGIISTAIYVYLLSQWNLYGDLIINIYYTVMSVYGWYIWSKVVGNSNQHIPASRTTNKEKFIALGIFISASVFVIFIYRYFNVMPNDLGFVESFHFAIENLTSGSLEKFRIAVPYLDTFTTASAFVAMWLMAIKKIENWTFWIVTNIVSIPLYFIKGYGFTGIQYFVFLVLAIIGYIEWNKKLKK